jgi:hypothetical protein
MPSNADGARRELKEAGSGPAPGIAPFGGRSAPDGLLIGRSCVAVIDWFMAIRWMFRQDPGAGTSTKNGRVDADILS